MVWIQTVDEADATGIVKAEYDAAIARAGELYNIELDDFLEQRRDFNESNG